VKRDLTRDDESWRFECYVRALRTRLHERLAGGSAGAALCDLWNQYQALADPDAIEREGQQIRDGEAPARQRARLRLHHRVSLSIHQATAAHQDRVDQAIARYRCQVGGDEVPLIDLQARLRTTPAAAGRATLLAVEDEALRRLEPDLVALWDDRRTATQHLHHRSYRELFAECRDVHDCDQLCGIARRILDDTQTTYDAAISSWAPHVVGMDWERLTYSDLAWLQRGEAWRALFERRIVPAMTTLVDEWCLDRATAIKLDVAERSGKSVRPYTAALNPPGDVWLVARPSGSPRDLEELLHEAGHAIAFVSVRPDDPWDVRYLSCEEVAESFAYLAGRLARDPRFLVDVVGLPIAAAEEYASYAAAIELLMVRRYCAKVLSECAALADPPSESRYASLIEEAIGLRPDPARMWWETDEELTSLDYLRAWLLEASLHEYLQRQCGERWFRSPCALEILRPLWRAGGELDATMLARIAGVEPLSTESLLAWCRQVTPARPRSRSTITARRRVSPAARS
jgi:hypothetical protein